MNIDTIIKNVKEKSKSDNMSNSNRINKDSSVTLINYSPEENVKDLSYIDKFLKVISNNGRLTIQYSEGDDAYMNMQTETITLPNYITKDRDIYLMIGSHEISHSLHTPREFYKHHDKKGLPIVGGVKLNKNLSMCINIVEDIRIEKLIRNKFPGFVSTYQRAHEKLAKTNPNFRITEQIWDNLSIANKINIKAKVGSLLKYELTSYEYALYKYMASAVTFNDVLVRSLYLYKEMIKDMNEMTLEEPDDNKAPEDSPETDQECDNLGNNTNTQEDKPEGNTKGTDEDSDKNNSDSDPTDGQTDESNEGQESESTGDQSSESKSKSSSNSKGQPSESEFEDMLDKLENALKNIENSDDFGGSEDEEYSQKLLEKLNDMASLLEDLNPSDEKEFDDDILEEGKEIYKKNVNKNNTVGILSGKKSKNYGSIIKDPYSALVTF